MSDPFDDRYRRNGEWFPEESLAVTDSTWERLSKATSIPEGPALSAGCGTARVMEKFFSLGREVAGFDVSPVAVESARFRIPSGNWKVADAGAAWPYPSATYALVVDECCLHHMDWPKRAIFLKEARRVIRDDGVLLLASNLWGGPDGATTSDRTTVHENQVIQTYSTERELRSEIERAGFEIERFNILVRDLPFAEVVARPRIGERRMES